ncbi:Mur ligase family protein [Streptomyces sp. NPDC001970]
MKLNELLDGYAHQVLQGAIGTRISGGMHFDAHRMTRGSLYIAVPGHREGGPDGITRAVEFGAVAVLVEGAGVIVPDGVCVVRVPDVRVVASAVAARYYGEPGRAMDMVAITGTNGKTSVSYMVESVLRIAEGARVGVIGTAGSRIGDDPVPMPHSVLTTPESPDLQYLLGHMRDRRTGSVVLEATSMALLTHRVDDAHIDVGVFTNIAGRLSDLCVLTSDNPRTEDPGAILDQIVPGITPTGTPFERIPDRSQAIRFALAAAGPDDVVLVAGKGSEPHQIIGEELLPFSDMAVVRQLSDELSPAQSGAADATPR